MVSIMIKDRGHSFQRGNAVLSDFIRLGHAQSYKGIHLIYLDKLFFFSWKSMNHLTLHSNLILCFFTKPEIYLSLS